MQRLHFKPAYAFVPIARTITTSTRYRLFNFDQMLIYVVHEHYLWRRLLWHIESVELGEKKENLKNWGLSTVWHVNVFFFKSLMLHLMKEKVLGNIPWNVSPILHISSSYPNQSCNRNKLCLWTFQLRTPAEF